MSISSLVLNAMRRPLTTAVVAGSAFTGFASAQSVSPLPAATAAPALFANTSAVPNFGASAADSQFSSSLNPDAGDVKDAATNAAQTNLASLEKIVALPGVDAQYGRRRYGAPRYRGSNTNADGSEKYTGFLGVGFTLPEGTNSNYLKTSYGFQVGGGRNFNKKVGLNLQFDWDKFGFTGDTITTQNILYSDLGVSSPVDGGSHIWSLTLDPIYYLKSGEGLGVYVTGGGGFYHKTANFFVQAAVTGFDPYYGEYEYVANETIDKYTSNSAGVNGGIGVTYKFSRFANERLYGEVRYVHTFNSYRPGSTIDVVNETSTGSNFFPQNSQSTSYLPVKVGIRF